MSAQLDILLGAEDLAILTSSNHIVGMLMSRVVRGVALTALYQNVPKAVKKFFFKQFKKFHRLK